MSPISKNPVALPICRLFTVSEETNPWTEVKFCRLIVLALITAALRNVVDPVNGIDVERYPAVPKPITVDAS